MVRIGLLGGVRVTVDGSPVDVGSAKSQVVLAALALSFGTPLSVSRLIELVWGDEPPQTAPKALQWHIAQLRKGLGADAIVRVEAAYRLDVPPDAVDVARFQRHFRAGDFAAALAEWGGTPLAGLDAPGLAASVAGLTEQWLSAVEGDLERRAEADPRDALGPLAELAERYPLREHVWALLMTALYRVGRQADALAAYQQARDHLVAELAVEPGPELQELETLILSHDKQLLGYAPLPSRLIGRDADLTAITDALTRSPVVTLVGPGGIGKTKLALATGHRWVVELAEIIAPGDVPRAVADALGAPQVPGRGLTESIVAFLRSRQAVLVIDNCEHVISSAASVVQAIVAGCPRVRVLATSRERLSVGDERVLVVGPLAPADGAELFTVRALATGYDASGDRQHVEEICRRLDGIPLAIELAAARTASHDPADLVSRLRVIGRRTGAVRHRTVEAAIQWSYDLLTSAEQTLFQQLSVFTAPFDLSAAEAVAQDADALGDLVERSMVVVETGHFGRRFRVLEPLRQFAAARLAEPDVVAARHARWCVGEVARIHGLLTGPGESEGVARLADLWPNLRAAVTWACSTVDFRLADALVRPIVTELPLRGRQEIGVWAERILAADPVFWSIWVAERYTQNANPAGYFEVAAVPDQPLSRYAHAYVSGDGEALWKALPDAAADLDSPFLAAYLEMTSAGPLLGIGRFAEVDASVTALAARYRVHGPPTLLHWALQTLGYSAAFQGRPDHADQYFDEASLVDVPAGTLSANKSTEARSAFRRGEHQRAFRLLRSSIDELVDADNIIAASVVSIEFISMMAAIDRIPEAAHVLNYLKNANEFGALASRTLLANAVTRIPDTPTAPIDDRTALTYMRAVLTGLM